VPAMPDFHLMFPIKFSGRSMWDFIGPNATESIQEARLAAFEHFGLDAWIDGGVEFAPPRGVEHEDRIEGEDDERITIDHVAHTPKGDLVTRVVYPKWEGAWAVEYPVQDPIGDMPKVECLLDADPERGNSAQPLRALQERVGERGAVFSGGGRPGLEWWFSLRSSQQGIMDVHDHIDVLLPIWRRYEELDLARTRITCESGARVVYGGGSYTSLSLISPGWYERYVLPHIARTAELCHRHDVPFAVQINGRCSAALGMLARVGVDAVLPLEPRPLGDCDLAEARRRVGSDMCFIGNLDPCNALLQGSPEDVRQGVKTIIEAAGKRGLIVSTADQTARDTPHENLRAYREAVEEYGQW